MQNPRPVLDKIPIASDGEYCINFSKYWGGGGCVAPRTPPTREKNSFRITPCISGENSCITYPPHRGFHDKKRENSRKHQHQSARNGLRMNHLHLFFSKKKPNNNPGRHCPLLQEEKC